MTRRYVRVARLRAAERLHGMGGVRLGELLRDVAIVGVDGGGVGGSTPMRCRSRSARCATTRAPSSAGDLFVATRGQTVDGHAFVGAAAAQGAVARRRRGRARRKGSPASRVRVRVGARRRWRRSRPTVAGRPADAMTLIGITGTNGKTTTTYLVEALARAAGGEPGVIGTVSYRFGDGRARRRRTRRRRRWCCTRRSRRCARPASRTS